MRWLSLPRKKNMHLVGVCRVIGATEDSYVESFADERLTIPLLSPIHLSDHYLSLCNDAAILVFVMSIIIIQSTHL